ncbi:hypothetical protein SH139x_004725 [Planctomycetaceae bacterium SH139]
MIKKRPKPGKPYPEFPLYPHHTGRWAKKIRGKTHYFGSWDEPDQALDLYLRQKDDLHAGRKPRESTGGVTLHELVNRFLHAKREAVATGELVQKSWNVYQRVGQLILRVMGESRSAEDVDQEDFAKLRAEMASRMDLVSLANEVVRCRVVFNYGWKTKMLRQPPDYGLDYGLAFAKPSKKALRINLGKNPKKLFRVTELRALIYAADPQLRAMVLLAINCGLGNTDCAQLRFGHLELARGWLEYGRPKTGVDRKAKLWPETVDAIGAATGANERFRARVEPSLQSVVFLTRGIVESCVLERLKKVAHPVGT